MFAIDTSYQVPARSKRAPIVSSLLAFNAKTGKNYDVGTAGEKLAIAMLEDAGYKAYKPSHHGIDIRAVNRYTGEIYNVEVKTATRSESRKNWQFCLNKKRHTELSHSDYLILFCVAESTVFAYLLPSVFLAGISQFVISSHPEKYKGKVAAFRNRGLLSFQEADEIYQLGLLQ